MYFNFKKLFCNHNFFFIPTIDCLGKKRKGKVFVELRRLGAPACAFESTAETGVFSACVQIRTQETSKILKRLSPRDHHLMMIYSNIFFLIF